MSVWLRKLTKAPPGWRRLNASASAWLLRFVGIRRGGRKVGLRPSPAAGAARGWMITPMRSSPLLTNSATERSMRLWPRWASEGFLEAARRCFAFWNVTASRSKKKVLHAAEQEREDVARARRRWIREQGLLDSTHLVFIDETSVNTNMTRPFGRGPRGERVIGRVPFAAWKTLTFVASRRCAAIA